jgi:GNAT superfamily N-acetyltransferase
MSTLRNSLHDQKEDYTMKNHTLNFSAFDFQEATFEERYQCWRANSDSWAGKLSKEDYVAREALNGNQSLTRNRAQRYWVFKGPKYQGPEGETSIYSSVETFRKEVVSKFANGTFKKYIAYGIASVFTIPEHRGKGVASAMMERLAQWLDSDEAECDFSVLYSDIGVSTAFSSAHVRCRLLNV